MSNFDGLSPDFQLLNNLPVAIGLCDVLGNFCYVNELFTETTGYNLKEISNFVHLTEKVFPDSIYRKSYSKIWLNSLELLSAKKQGQQAWEFTIRCNNQSLKQFFVHFRIAGDNLFSISLIEASVSNQQPVQYSDQVNKTQKYSTKQSILKEKTNDNNEDYYKQIVNIANVAILKFDKDLLITEFTGNSENIFGYKKEEVIGKSLSDTIIPKYDSTGKYLGNLSKELVKNTELFEHNVNENITKSGKRIWMQWHNSQIKDSNNQLVSILSIGIDITNIINAEFALKESEERFKMLSNLTFEGILIHEKGIILDCNLSFEKQIGYGRNELIGTNLFKIIPPQFHKLMKDNIKNNVNQYEIEAIHKNGTIIPVSVVAKRVKINDKFVRVVAARDISDLKKTIKELDKYKNHLEEIVKKRTEEIKLQSKELAEQNEILQFERNQLRTLIDNIPDHIYIKDSKSRFLNANKRVIKHFGQKKLEDVIGKTDFDFYDESYAKEYFADEQNIVKSKLPIIDREELSINEKGQQIYLSSTKVPLLDKTGEIISIVGVGRDITEKKIAENKLKEQAENLKEINIQLEERSNRIVKLNNELKDSNQLLEEANVVLHEKKEELETALEHLKSAQSHIVQSEKMASLGVLMAGIAHEINNPVNFVFAGVNSIMKDFDDIRIVMEKVNSLSSDVIDIKEDIKEIEKLKEEYEFDIAFNAVAEILQDIKLGASRIAEIVAGLSRFSRLETEKWKTSNLHEELDSVLVLLKNKYKHQIEIIKNYSNNLPVVECYPGKLNQVFMNIINNAIDAIGGKPGKISITTGYAEDMASISISDNGKGIPESDLAKIFDPFFTTKEVGYGMGLGLAISYSIIQEHKGKIEVKSVVGKGTEFLLTFPVTQVK